MPKSTLKFILAITLLAVIHACSPVSASANIGPIINVWYGNYQGFGHIGMPQRWVNILGNVSDNDGVASLSFSLNGGLQQSLSYCDLWPRPNARLMNRGDFNAEIPFANLSDGFNEVLLTATDTWGNLTTELVTVNYQSGNVWPTSYTIDWNSVFQINDVSQVVDGLWTLETDSVRPVELGYDRLIAIGDVNWDDYEVSVPITIHGLDPLGYNPPSNGPAVGLVLRWPGHTADGKQPSVQWWPLGALGYYRYYSDGSRRLELLGNKGKFLRSSYPDLSFDIPYIFKMRVETVANGSQYSLKIWRQGDPEPIEWDLTGQESLSDPQNGSLLLLSHHVDASFGDVNVVSLAGPDTSSPVISNIQAAPGDISATITWQTNEPATSRVLYGPTTAYEYGAVLDSTLVTHHSTVLAGLTPGTLYHYKVISEDGSGNLSSSVDLSFTTTLLDLTPPVISNIQVNAGSTFATVSWVTDEPATSRVDYGFSALYEGGFTENSSPIIAHSITLTNLIPNTSYHYQVASADNGGNSSSSSDLIFTTQPSGTGSSGIISDDFYGTGFDSTLWAFINPFNDAVLSMTGTQVAISLPPGQSHDPWTSNDAVRIMQPCNDTDFEVEVKFDSEVLEKYQMQGIIIEQDIDNYLRFDLLSVGSGTRLYAAAIQNGTPSARGNLTIPGGAPIYMRVKREGNLWTQSYSNDGLNWNTKTSFNHILIPTAIGPFVGNYSTGSAPAFTGIFDYFFNTASPIVPEDTVKYHITTQVAGGGQVLKNPEKPFYLPGDNVELTAVADTGWEFSGWSGDLTGPGNPAQLIVTGDHLVSANFSVINDITSPVISGVQASPGSTNATVTWTTNEPATGSVFFGPTTVYENGNTGGITLVTSHSIILTGLTPATTYHYQVTSADSSGNSSSSVDLTFTTLDTVPPGTVTGFAASDDQPGQISLSWINPSDSDLAEIRVRRKSGSYPASHDDVTAAFVYSGLGSNFIDATVLVGTTYYYAVFTRDSSGNWNKLVIPGINTDTGFSPDLTSPVISGVQASPGSTNATVTWTTDEPAAGSVFFGPTTVYENGNTGDSTLVTSHSIILTGLTPATTYHYQVTSADSSGNSSSSADMTFTTLDTIPPGTVTGFAASDDQPGQISLSWVNPSDSDLAEIRVLRKSGSYPASHDDATTTFVYSGLGNNFIDATVLEGTTYYYAVFTRDASGNWNESVIPGTTADTGFSPDTTPPVISNVQASRGSTTAIITWTTDEPATGSVSFGPTTVYENGNTGDITLVASHSITLTGLTPGTTYHYQVTSTDSSGNSSSSADLTFATLPVPSSPSGIISDDFSGTVLNENLWTFINPFGDAGLSMTGTQLVISLPPGQSHDPWTSNDSVRLMQPSSDTDFEVEVKFDSEVLQKYQMQGIIIEQDNGNYLRFDFLSVGSSTRIFAASITNNSPTTEHNRIITGGFPVYMRVKREGNLWSQTYSHDGLKWSTAAAFTHDLAVTSVGPYAGNYSGGSAPAFNCVIDYFFNTITPIIPEDGTQPTL